MADLLRQAVYSRLAGYEDVNDAERLEQDPAFRLMGSERIWERGAALLEIRFCFSHTSRCTNARLRRWAPRSMTPIPGEEVFAYPASPLLRRRPDPIPDLRLVNSFRVSVIGTFDDLVLEPLF